MSDLPEQSHEEKSRTMRTAAAMASLLTPEEAADEAVAWPPAKPQAMRANATKPPLHYLFAFPHAARGFAAVCKHGESKYEKYNCMKGLKLTELIDSMSRHMAYLMEGQNVDEDDPKTGQKGSHLPHVDHIVWNAILLSEMFHVRPDMDDRPKLAAALRPADPPPTTDSVVLDALIQAKENIARNLRTSTWNGEPLR
jgi:hypothetical protein